MRKRRPEPRMVTLTMRVTVDQLRESIAQAAHEMRTLSAMTRILLTEALAARVEKETEQITEREGRG